MGSTEEVHLAAALRGDREAWGTLVTSLKPYLLTGARRALGSDENNSDCSSVVQEGVVRATMNLQQFRGHSLKELKAWLAAIVRNHAADRQREGARIGSLIKGASGADQVAAAGSTPSARADRRERAAQVLAAIERLAPDYRRVLNLRFFQDLDFQEVARQMDRTNDAVRCLCVRALRELREQLDGAV